MFEHTKKVILQHFVVVIRLYVFRNYRRDSIILTHTIYNNKNEKCFEKRQGDG